MDNLESYIRWMGDYPIALTGFKEADALVLCALSYIDFTPAIYVTGNGACRVSDCAFMVQQGQAEVMITGDTDGYPELLAVAAQTKRFGELRISDYCDVLRKEPPLQFSAMCFSDDEDFAFIAYRGTDSSLAGWKEDFMIGFTRTAAQELALQYAREVIKPGKRWYLGGHSKGANLALYAASLLEAEKWQEVERVFLLDGPGFCPEVMDVSLTEHIDEKTTQIRPSFSVVGKLFSPQITDSRIIRSFYKGIMQHAIISWGIEYGKLAEAKEHDKVSLLMNESMDEWISGMTHEERILLVDELFETLSAGGAEDLNDIKAGGREGVEAIIKRLRSQDENTKKALTELRKTAVKNNFEMILTKLGDEVEELFKKKEA